MHVYSSHDEVVARSRGEIQWLQRLQAALRDGFFELYVQPIEPARPGATERARDRGVRAPARRGPGDRPGRVLPGGGALPADVHDRPLGARLGARRALGGRDPPAAGAEPVDQHLGADARRPDLPRVRRGRARPHRRRAGADLLRGRGVLGDRQHRAGAALHRRAARHGLQLRARRLRHRPRRLREPQAAADGLPEDRRFLHARPRPRHA